MQSGSVIHKRASKKMSKLIMYSEVVFRCVYLDMNIDHPKQAIYLPEQNKT